MDLYHSQIVEGARGDKKSESTRGLRVIGPAGCRSRTVLTSRTYTYPLVC
jgi:hypothetical protein